MRRWVGLRRERLLSVCFFPSFLARKREGGFQTWGHRATPAGHDFQSLFCWDKPPKPPPLTHPSPIPWSGPCVDVSVFDATFGLCVGAFHPSMHSPSVCWPFWSGCINLGRNAASDNPQSNWCVGKSKLSWTCSKRDDPSRPQMSHDCFHPNRLN